jgi:hypothetical protein
VPRGQERRHGIDRCLALADRLEGVLADRESSPRGIGCPAAAAHTLSRTAAGAPTVPSTWYSSAHKASRACTRVVAFVIVIVIVVLGIG